MNTDKIIAESIAKEYAPKEHSKIIALKKLDAKLILSSDSHHADTLDCAFAETTALLRDVGYRKLMTLKQGKFVEYEL